MKMDDFIRDVHSIVISGHVKPDGDCIGSVLALYLYLTENCRDISVSMFLEEASEKFRFLKGFEKIDHEYERDIRADLMIVLDCSNRERLGRAEKYFANAQRTICLDHHVSNTLFAGENFVDAGAGSACEVLFSFLDPEKMNRDIAMCLYTGIISDTGVFKYPSTSPKTMRIAAELMEYGLDTNFIIDEAFYAKDWNENRILGYAVMNSSLYADGRIIVSSVTKEDMEHFGVSSSQLDGIVSQLRLTRGVDCAVFAYETGVPEYKISLRTSEAVDGNKVAGIFGGGGHERAAGMNVRGELETVLEAVVTEVEKSMRSGQL